MAEAPPHVEVHTVGVKHDYGDPPAEPSRRVPPPPDAPRCPDTPDDEEGS